MDRFGNLAMNPVPTRDPESAVAFGTSAETAKQITFDDKFVWKTHPPKETGKLWLMYIDVNYTSHSFKNYELTLTLVNGILT